MDSQRLSVEELKAKSRAEALTFLTEHAAPAFSEWATTFLKTSTTSAAWRCLWPEDLFCFFSGKSSSSAFRLSRRLQFLGRSCRTLRSTTAPPCDLADDGSAWPTCWTTAKVWVLDRSQLLCGTKWPLSRSEPTSKPTSVRRRLWRWRHEEQSSDRFQPISREIEARTANVTTGEGRSSLGLDCPSWTSALSKPTVDKVQNCVCVCVCDDSIIESINININMLTHQQWTIKSEGKCVYHLCSFVQFLIQFLL